MAFRKDRAVIDDNAIIAKLDEMVDIIRNEEDPEVLNRFRGLFRSRVPFFLRSYAAAYLLKTLISGGRLREGRGSQDARRHAKDERHDHDDRGDRIDRANRGDRMERNEKATRTEKGEKPKDSRQGPNRGSEEARAPKEKQDYALDPAQAAQLFIGIGRNRRVYPRDLISLLVGTAGLEREEIGELKVLENYSFAQVAQASAQKAIDALDGFEYRGKRIVANFARKKGSDAPIDKPDSPASEGGQEKYSSADALSTRENLSSGAKYDYRDDLASRGSSYSEDQLDGAQDSFARDQLASEDDTSLEGDTSSGSEFVSREKFEDDLSSDEESDDEDFGDDDLDDDLGDSESSSDDESEEALEKEKSPEEN